MFEGMRRRAAAFLAACLLAALVPANLLTAYAASGRIAFSDPSAAVGGQVTVKMKVTASGANLMSADVMLAYDSSLLEFVEGTDAEGGAGAVRVHGDGGTPNTGTLAFELKFKALAAGTAKLSVSSQEVYDADSKLVTIDKLGDSTITIGAQENASSDATLKSLAVSPGTLSPEFSPEIDTYTVTVGTDVEKLIVSAAGNDANATTVVSGNEELQMGENRVTCKVTAQDGKTTKEYVIVVTKAEGGASAGETALTGNEVKLSSSGKTITILTPEAGVSLPEGFVETPIDIDGSQVTGWVMASEEEPQYCIVYGMNDAGEKNFYRYDLAENERTIQRYFEASGQELVAAGTYNALVKDFNHVNGMYKITIAVIGVVTVIAVLLLLAVIGLLIGKKKSQGQPDPDRRKRQVREPDLEEPGEEEPYEAAAEKEDVSLPEPARARREASVTRVEELEEIPDLELEDGEPEERPEKRGGQAAARAGRPARRPSGGQREQAASREPEEIKEPETPAGKEAASRTEAEPERVKTEPKERTAEQNQPLKKDEKSGKPSRPGALEPAGQAEKPKAKAASDKKPEEDDDDFELFDI